MELAAVIEFERGNSLDNLGRHEEAVAVQKLSAWPISQTTWQKEMARALVRKGTILEDKLQRYAEAAQTYDEFLNRFDSDPDPDIIEWVLQVRQWRNALA